MRGGAAGALVLLAAAIASGEDERLASAISGALDAGAPPRAVEELLLQSVLTVGWPRALVAAELWRAAAGPYSDSSPADEGDPSQWPRRGETTFGIIYGQSSGKLRARIRALHPALESWLINEAYGRTLSRPGLDLKSREMCTIAQTVVLETPRQLHSHLLGATRAGATAAEIDDLLRLLDPVLTDRQRTMAASTWTDVRTALVTR